MWRGSPPSNPRCGPCSASASTGFPDRDGTIAQYESLSGHSLHDLEWYEILALTRSTAILARIGYLHRDAGLPSPLPLEDNPLLDLLAARIAAADGNAG